MSPADVPPIGARIRAERTLRGLTVRGLARDVGVSASLISQIETDKSRPSVSTLYAITSALGMSLADLLDHDSPGTEAGIGSGATGRTTPDRAEGGQSVTSALSAMLTVGGGIAVRAQRVSSGRSVTGPNRDHAVGPLVAPAERELISLDSGVTWERLGQVPGAQVDFLLVTYQPGGTSSSNGELMRHSGSEYGYLLSGALTLRLGFDEHQLTPGDAVCFASSTPHGYRNTGAVPAVGVWVVLDQDC